MSSQVWLGLAFALRFAWATENSTELPFAMTAVVSMKSIGLEEKLPSVHIIVRTSACPGAGTTFAMNLHLGTLNPMSRQLKHVADPFELHAEGPSLKQNTSAEQIFKLSKQDVYYGGKCAKHRSRNSVGRCWPMGNIIFIQRQKSVIPVPDAWKPDEIEVRVRYWNPRTQDADINRYVHKFSKSCDEQWIETDGLYRIGPDGIFVDMGNEEGLINVGEAYY